MNIPLHHGAQPPAGDTENAASFGTLDLFLNLALQLIFQVVIEVSLSGDTQVTRGSTC